MKANQKFMKNDDEAVSPVIAVILMVAITVVLAATVYVWVSGFGSSANNSQQHTLSATSASAISEVGTSDVFIKKYTVSSADPSLTYGDMRLALDGAEYVFDADGCGTAGQASSTSTTGIWSACAGSTARAADDLVKAGDTIVVSCYEATQTAPACLGDKTMVITDIEANSVMLTLAVR